MRDCLKTGSEFDFTFAYYLERDGGGENLFVSLAARVFYYT